MYGRLYFAPNASFAAPLRQLHLDFQNIPKINNAAPTTSIPIITGYEGRYALSNMRWWLHPHWSREEPNTRYSTFNARIETILTSKSYGSSVRQRRGIVPASGFIEWKAQEGAKQPFWIDAGEEPLFIAAIWDSWQDEVFSCAVVTQDANDSFSAIHHRMPLTLTLEQSLLWLSPALAEQVLNELSGQSLPLSWVPVSPEVNNARFKGNVTPLV